MKLQKRYGVSSKTSMKEMTKSREQNFRPTKENFENLKMKEEENIATYFLRVDEIVNIIRGL